jgi:tetratricopeptide (TPR) repeat protein
MEQTEADIYGDRVLNLLQSAEEHLAAKYEVELQKPVYVEIFPQQSDFAIRTFGLPGGAGFLGVCFGNLITANSPASQQSNPTNWESVLWHEFCHVITLQKTQNRMPRWLSEGISVYEEVQRDPAWGQRLNPTYKLMLLSDDFTPLSELSSAFLRPKSPVHLEFAYFESSLAVQYLIEEHGLPLLLKTLDDLGLGVPIHEAFARRYGDAEKLDADFKRYVEQLAGEFLAETEFSAEDVPARGTIAELRRWVADNPRNYAAQLRLTTRLMGEQQWEGAIEEAEKLLELYPEDTSAEGGLQLVARCARELERTEREREALSQLVELSGDELDAVKRLIVLAEQAEDWSRVLELADQLLAIQPLIAIGHEAAARAARELQRPEPAIAALQALLTMEPLDPAEAHLQLAQAHYDQDAFDEARREVLLALEQTPRYREAQRLLLRLHKGLEQEASSETDDASDSQGELDPPSDKANQENGQVADSQPDSETSDSVEAEGDNGDSSRSKDDDSDQGAY